MVSSASRTNAMGRPTAFVLYPEDAPVLLADDASSVAKRAEFARKHLYVTAYDPAERYAAGDFVHQNPGGDGVAAYVTADRPLDGEDLVLWHTFGPTHFPRPEDWPVMPMDYAKFKLKPYGFFDKNPTLGVPAPVRQCSPGHVCADGCCG
jgi:primary-amine oxidase